MSNSKALSGKLAIVTGASRGIGTAVSENLAAKGAHLILVYTSDSSTQRTSDLAEKLQKEHGVKAIIVKADMGSETGPASVVEAAKKHFSGLLPLGSTKMPNMPKAADPPISIIVNNAGVSEFDRLEDSPQNHIKTFHKQYNTNVLGPLLLVNAALPHLPYDRTARIVNVSSVSASMGPPGQSVYGGTKAALDSMTRTWARELADRGTVNSVNPGPVKTDMYGGVPDWFAKWIKPALEMTPGAEVREERDGKDGANEFGPLGGRPASSEEIAGVVGMLCLEDSYWCNASSVNANGGFRMNP